MFIDYLYVMWPALWPLLVSRTPGDQKYHVRFLLDGSKIQRPATTQTTMGSDPAKCGVAFDRALNVVLEKYKYTNPRSGPTGRMHDAVMALWDGGDVRFVAPGEPALSTSELNAFLHDIP